MNLDTPAARRWQQVNIHFTDYATAGNLAVSDLYPVLRQAEDDGLLDSWWFIRKAPCWRLRYHPSKSTQQAAQGRLHSALDTMQQHAKITRWGETIYKPETHAFGGDIAMRLAHRLFHQDSQRR